MGLWHLFPTLHTVLELFAYLLGGHPRHVLLDVGFEEKGELGTALRASFHIRVPYEHQGEFGCLHHWDERTIRGVAKLGLLSGFELLQELVGRFRPSTLLDVQDLHEKQMVVVGEIGDKRGVLSAFSCDIQRGLAHYRLCTRPRACDVRSSSVGSPGHVFHLGEMQAGRAVTSSLESVR